MDEDIDYIDEEVTFTDQVDLFSRDEIDEENKNELSDRRLVTQSYDFSVSTIVEQITKKIINTHPSFQRNYVWDTARSSSLIESLLLNIPIPACYLAEDEQHAGKFTVIDGQQRLYSIWRYIKNKYPLDKLEALPSLAGKFFRDLKETQQNTIKGRYIRCVVVTQESDADIKFEVFERLNRGALPATDQEIRNAIFQGDFNDLIKSLTKRKIWRQVLDKTELDIRMRDEELILRFFAVHYNYVNYQPPLKKFLSDYMRKLSLKNENGKKVRITLASEEKQKYTDLFLQTMQKVKTIFGEHAFKIYMDGKWEKQVNKALFDAVTLIVSQISKRDATAKASEIDTALRELFEDNSFLETTSGSKGHRVKFVKRIKMLRDKMNSIGFNIELDRAFLESK